MLITVPIEELKVGDKLCDGFFGTPQDEAMRNSEDLISEARATPTVLPEAYERARTVRNAPVIGRMYVSITMGTYAVVRRRKGTLVSVYWNGGNEPQDVSPAVLETVQATTVGGITYPAMVETLPAETEEVPYGPERQPFNYARSQFRQLGNYRETEYPTKLKIQNDNGETHWMNIHPDDLAELQRLMEAREDNS